ncbi:rRNA-processing protein fcf2-like [Phoenix dactylifera]|uniref:rRNA-processing protein fcf2-like n=1 Tax=Phoenix dactylifera TaxID=42345 RepID=A0A8B9AR73_PHODC|nr:rRNA-processing protein fcf2-like [Phoenix dactylifera]XP_038988940.1 rRNA-processing protein fcf2-like [Phoenix dactylifera]
MPEENSSIGLSWAPKVPPLTNGNKNSSEKSRAPAKDSVWRPGNELVDGLFVPPSDPRKLNKLLKKSVKDTAGGSWFDMPAPTITPELKKDLEILKLRSAIDPKRHFKRGEKSKALPKYFQVGTIIEPASEFFSGRLKKKERKATLADELLSDHAFKAYRKRKVQEIEEKRQPGGVDKWKNKGRQTWKRAKQRREKAGH